MTPNQKLIFIINRAAEFRTDKYPYILLGKLEDNYKDELLYYIIDILALVKQVPLYILKSKNFPDYVEKEKHHHHYINVFKYFYLRYIRRGMRYSTDAQDDMVSDNLPPIFQNFTRKELQEIVEYIHEYERLYGS